MRFGRWKLPMCAFSYNNSLARFELIFATIDGPEFLLVVTNPSDGVELVFTELEAFRASTTDDASGNPTFKSTFYRDQYRRELQALQVFGRRVSHSTTSILMTKSSGDKVREDDRINWSGRMSLTALPYVTPSMGYSETRLRADRSRR